MACAFFFGPFGPSGHPDPTIIQTAPKPDFAFLWIYAVLAFLPPSIETPVMLIVPVLVIAGMLLLPLAGERGGAPLGTTSGSRSNGFCDCRDPGNLHSPRHIHAMESDDGCVDE